MTLRFLIYLLSLLSSIIGFFTTPYWVLKSPVAALPKKTFTSATEATTQTRFNLPRTLKEPTSVRDELKSLIEKAYLWGWPLVYLHNCKRAMENVPAPGRSGGMPVAPINRLCMLSDLISPHAKGVPCANPDVIYGFGMFDLEEEAVVIQVPNFGDRYWLFQLGDQRTDSFARIGKMYGTPSGFYLVVGPQWQGEVPAGITQVLRCPTNLCYCLPRIYVEGPGNQDSSLQSSINHVVAYPLSEYSGQWKKHDWSKARWLPSIRSGNRTHNKWVHPEHFFEDLCEVLEDLSPLPGEERLYVEIQRLFQLARSDDDLREWIIQTAQDAEANIIAPLFHFHNFGEHLPHFWTTIHNGAAFGKDYHTRTAVAKSNIFVNRREETLYYYQECDAAGSVLSGNSAYSITFPPGQLPEVQGFWSVTVYDENHALHANPFNRHSLGSRSHEMKMNPDGSLTIYLQSSPPSAEHYSNWLPIPSGKFCLYLRAYWPSDRMLNEQWNPPPVERVEVQTSKSSSSSESLSLNIFDHSI